MQRLLFELASVPSLGHDFTKKKNSPLSERTDTYLYLLSLALALSIHNKLQTTDDGASGVQSAQSDRGQFHFRRAAFSQQLKSKVGLALTKVTALRINLNLDGASINLTLTPHTRKLLVC